jgi:hypothetical protein
MPRRFRIVAAVVAMFALLFSQLALSAFACPREAQASSVEMAAEHCDKSVNMNVCDLHCEYGASNVGHASLDAPVDVLAFPLPWRAQAASAPAPSTCAPHDLAARSHHPPPLALFGALRI